MAKEENDIVLVPTVCANINQYAVVPELNGCTLTSEPDNGIERIASNDNEDALVQSTYNIENSNDVVIGPVTHFHCPVTIIQKAETTSNTDIEKICGLETNTKPKDVPNAFKYFDKLNFKTRRKLLYIIVPTLIVLIFIVATLIILLPSKTSSHVQKDEPIVYHDVEKLGETQIIPRTVWGARPPLSIRVLEHPVKYVIVAHTGTGTCKKVVDCSPILQTLQSKAVADGSPDIGYNFLIGSDGNVYVGRGWDAINYLQPHTISIAFIGNFIYDDFTENMQTALSRLIEVGVKLQKLDDDYILLSHSQTWSTLSPGVNIQKVIETWPHYYPKDYIEIPD